MLKDDHILVLMDSYYPNSRATTYIMQKLLERFENPDSIYVITLDLIKNDYEHFCGIHNGINVIPISSLNEYTGLLRIIKKTESKITKSICKARFQLDHEYDNLFMMSLKIKSLIRKKYIKKMVSVSSPEDIHICAYFTKKCCRDVEWFPICFDPYAYNVQYDTKTQNMMRKEEVILYNKAKQIFMLRQSEQDYTNSELNKKITYIDIPIDFSNSDEIVPSPKVCTDKILCVYMGNLFWDIRNPEFLLKLMEEIKDNRIKLMIVGKAIGAFTENYFEYWKEKMGNRIEFRERLSRQEAKIIANQANVLINIGNTAYNQCPSKLIEYISTGKPILHIRKIENCAAVYYLNKYQNKLIVNEWEGISDDLVKRVHDFLIEKYNKITPKEVLQREFHAIEYTSVSQTIQDIIINDA